MASLFDKLAAGRPPVEGPTPQQVPLAAGLLLDWLQNKWTRPTVHVRDICIYGPRPIRDRESAINSAEVLARQGWLVPMKSHRCDTKRWRIRIGD